MPKSKQTYFCLIEGRSVSQDYISFLIAIDANHDDLYKIFDDCLKFKDIPKKMNQFSCVRIFKISDEFLDEANDYFLKYQKVTAF